jgi:vacuolar protein-sorting-associated protein 4
MSGAANYRFVCPLCKHSLSPVQVERLARLIAPNRAPVNLFGMSVSAGMAVDLSKPARSSKSFPPLLGASSPSKFVGSDLPKASDPESTVRKKALLEAVVSKKPNVKWDDVAGLTPAKHELQRAIIFPARFPNLYDEKRRASGAILLYGPPGTGKSYLAKAVATEVDHTLFSISAGDLVSKWMGESEK